jgi:hypothetical protein
LPWLSQDCKIDLHLQSKPEHACSFYRKQIVDRSQRRRLYRPDD